MRRAKSKHAESASDQNGARRHALGTALGLAACSIVLPGVAHLRAGRRRVGGALLVSYLLLVGAAVYLALTQRDMLLRLSVQPRWLTAVMFAAIALALVWVLLVYWSYRVLRPARLRTGGRVTAALAVLVLCAVACVPFAGVSRYAYLQHDLVTSLFSGTGRHVHPTDRDPWNGRDRVNVLLLGGDAGRDRSGTRTDSMTLASVNVHTGATTMISLPRNLENAPFPPGPARHRFPHGYTAQPGGYEGLLNEVYRYGNEHPELAPGSQRPGPDLIKGVFAQVLGVQVDYYALIDMGHFADIVDAMGGVWMRVEQPIPYGQRGQIIKAGYRKLDGHEALWYGRSRTNSSDYVRMGRQKCVLAAIARQANPTTVLTKFSNLAATAKRTVSTDIPQWLLPHLLQLSDQVRDAPIDTLDFVPPKIKPWRPDWQVIRADTAKALHPRSSPTSHTHKKTKKSVDDTCPAPGPHG